MPLTDNQFSKAMEFIRYKVDEAGLNSGDIMVLFRWVLDKIADSNLSDLKNMPAINQYLLDKRRAYLTATKADLQRAITGIDNELNS